MKFVAIKSNIKEVISLIERAAGENINLPILKNTLITAANNIITFGATNLEIAITANASGKVIEDGAITVPLSLLLSVISNIQTDRVNFEVKEKSLEIKTDNYNATIQGLPADDFPITPKIEKMEQYLEVKGIFLKDAIQEVGAAAQFSDLRPELNSILFDFSLDTLKLVATDGFRLAEKTIAANAFTSKIKEPFKILVPLKTSYEMLRLAKDDDLVRIYRDDNQILFKTERAQLISRLIEGGFPDYTQIVPKKIIVEIVVEKEELLNGIKLASIFGQKNGEVEIKIHPGKKAIEIVSADQTLGNNAYLLPAKIKGEASEFVFSWRYLSDPLKVIKSEEVSIALQEDANPGIIRPAGDGSYFYIIKPILRP